MHLRSLLVLGALSIATGGAAPVHAQDIVLQWNAAALDAIRADSTPPTAASRNLAILHAAIFDAINGTSPRYRHYLVAPPAGLQASALAAAAAAGHDALVALHPSRVQTADALYGAMIAALPTGARTQGGIAWGEQVAQQVIAARADDGSTQQGTYPGSTVPGLWRPTISFGGVVRPALVPLWGSVRPFALPSGSVLRPPAPPALPTTQYALEVRHVQQFGRAGPSLRTAEQTQIAQFWGYGPNTATPPGHWNQIAQVVAKTQHNTLAQNARMLALLNVALADAAIISWDCKYHYGLWRPITAIQLADEDGNPLTIAEPSWTPLLETPPFPEYTSGHSTFSGAAAATLARFFGRDGIPFIVGSDDLPLVFRSYRRFSEAALESGMSRIYGGIHFLSGNVHGLITGYVTGLYAFENLMQPL